MTDLVMRRRGDRLEPADPVSAEMLQSLAAGVDLYVKVSNPRNPRHHRLAWGLAGKVAQALGGEWDAESVVELLKYKSGHVRKVVDPFTGEVHLAPKSIRFASLDQAAFSRLFNRWVFIICDQILPDVTEDELRNEILEMVGE